MPQKKHKTNSKGSQGGTFMGHLGSYIVGLSQNPFPSSKREFCRVSHIVHLPCKFVNSCVAVFIKTKPVMSHVLHHCLPVSCMFLNFSIELVAKGPEKTISIPYISIYVNVKFFLVSTWDLFQGKSQSSELVVEAEEIIKATLHGNLLLPSVFPSSSTQLASRHQQ